MYVHDLDQFILFSYQYYRHDRTYQCIKQVAILRIMGKLHQHVYRSSSDNGPHLIMAIYLVELFQIRFIYVMMKLKVNPKMIHLGHN
ncbi:hypothetical protein V1477_020930 [Vespula maculifrons]|uniref:Uncharacterized protein n=1 Tax=Vespula maculifrons TaxID=7453 RepID=A0ABD2AQE2_VESMC